MLHRKVYRICDEAQRMRLVVQLLRLRHIGPGRYRHFWPQHHSHEMPAAIGRLRHHAFRVIHIIHHHNSRDRANMQIRKLVTRRQRRHQKFLRIPPRPIPAKHRIGRSPNHWLALRRNLVLSLVGPIRGRPRPGIPRPLHNDRIVMFFACHRFPSGKPFLKHPRHLDLRIPIAKIEAMSILPRPARCHAYSTQSLHPPTRPPHPPRTPQIPRVPPRTRPTPQSTPALHPQSPDTPAPHSTPLPPPHPPASPAVCLPTPRTSHHPRTSNLSRSEERRVGKEGRPT